MFPLHAAITFVVTALLMGIAAGPARAAERPNVLFIAVDDMRCELGCYGVKHVLSPHLDQLAASGVLFTRAYCQQAVCNPSRVSLMTGLRPDTAKVWDLDTDFRTTVPDAVTIPQHFRQHGYRAVAFGKIFHNTFPDDVSWDEPTHMAKDVVAHSKENAQRLADFKARMKADGKPAKAIGRMRGPATEVQEQPDDMNFDGKQTTDALVKLRELASGQAPFFLAVGYIRPHLPFVTPKKYWDLYDRAKIPLAANPFFPRGMPPVAFGDRSLGGFYELRDYMDYADAPSPFERSLTEAQQRELRHGYYASVSFIDAQVGRLLAGLDELGLAKNTIVVLWSDHGWKLGEHNGWGKQTNYEIDTRAPLMIRAPGAKANGQRCDSLVEFVDIYPTLCDLAALPVPEKLEGRSLAPLLADASAKVKDAAFSQFPRKQSGRDYMGYAMRTERYRYVEWLDADTGRVAARELYDHDSDPDENENVASGSPLIEDLSAQMWKTLPKPKPAGRESRDLAGWSVRVSHALLDTDRAATEHALELMKAQLDEIVRAVPASAVAELRKVPLYVSPEYPGVKPKAEYHPDAGWLREHGRDPAMAKSVEFTNVRIFDAEVKRMPVFVLHELAHAYHDRVLGFEHAEIVAAYERAKAAKLYDAVARHRTDCGPDTIARAYAMTNHKEYFAETSEAFFGENDFFPFNRNDLAKHDPEMFALLARLWGSEPPTQATRGPLRVFILAGQSNMEGQAVVDLEGKNYNEGKGTLAALMRDPAKAEQLKHLRNADGAWTVRDDVWVRYQRENRPLLAGPLGIGFAVYGGTHHFGPELQFGHVVGDHFENQVLLIKTAWGGKSLFKDFRPPSSGGEVGPYYTKMLAEVREALASLKTDFPGYDGGAYELAGFVWYQGWNDGVDKNAVPEYESNLVNLIKDVRRELSAPKLPVVIGELTGPWVEAPGAWATLRQAQAAAAMRPEFAGNVVFVPTHDFVRKPEDSPNPGHGHHEFGNAETYFLVGDALGRAMRDLLAGPRR